MDLSCEWRGEVADDVGVRSGVWALGAMGKWLLVNGKGVGLAVRRGGAESRELASKAVADASFPRTSRTGSDGRLRFCFDSDLPKRESALQGEEELRKERLERMDAPLVEHLRSMLIAQSSG